jgi:tRNA(fMet)-specific endonuclease VapC
VYCFDTDVLAAALLREPPMQLVRRLARTPGDQQCTTAVSVAEIAYAAARNGDREVAGRVRDLVAAASTVLPFDHQAAEVYGSLRAHLERLGVRLDESSLRIAAIALSHDLTLVTASARLYDRVPDLRIENWLEPDELDEELDEELEEELEDELEGELEEEPVALDGADADQETAGNGKTTLGAGNGTVRHPGVVPQLEERVRLAAERAASQGGEQPEPDG